MRPVQRGGFQSIQERRFPAFVASLRLPLLFLGCLFLVQIQMARPDGLAAPEKKGKSNLLLITIDTLRTDRLSCYGSEHLRTPNMDGLAQNGIIFTRAFAHNPETLPSHTNILLGLTPLYHGVHENANFVVRDEFLTLGEHLKNYGYSTGAVIGGYPLHSRFGLAQGFDLYDDHYQTLKYQKLAFGERRAEEVVERASAWLKSRESPWFLWIHCFDPHDPYEPPEPFKTQYKERLYDGEVAYVDQAIGKLRRFLEKERLLDDTVMVFTADHGESLGQHDETTHGYLAYNTTLWVPLFISAPGIRPRAVDQWVSHIDIFPTVCDLLGLKKPPSLQGVSLLPAMQGRPISERAIYFESLYPYYSRGWAPLKGFLQSGEKFTESPLPELYDLVNDFDELQNLAGKKELDGYRQRLTRVIGGLSHPESSKAGQRADRESLQRLRSLGYISNPLASRKERFGPEDDIKTLLPYHNLAMRALELYQQGKKPEGFKLIRQAIAEKKDIDIAYSNLAEMYAREGQLPQALEVLKVGLESLPSNYGIFLTYAKYLEDAGRHEEVIDLVGANFFVQMDHDPEIWNYLGQAYLGKGEIDKSLEALEKAVAIDDTYAVVFRNLGNAYFRKSVQAQEKHALEKSIENFQRAVDIEPDYASAWNGLGVALRAAGRPDDAIRCWERAIELRPDVGYPLYNLGFAYLDKGEKARALDYFLKYKEGYSRSLSAEEKEKLEVLIQKCRKTPETPPVL
jgi:arylsulfatase A-like enzyme/Flp pilus assembly protein TadD